MTPRRRRSPRRTRKPPARRTERPPPPRPPREQRLPRSRRTGEQHSVRDAAAELLVLLRVTEEVDNLRQLALRLVDPRDVRERDLVATRLVTTCARAAERAENVLHVACAAHDPEEEKDEEDRRPEAEEQVLPPRRSAVERLRIHDDALLLQQPRQCVVVGKGRDLRPEAQRRLRPRVPLFLREGPLDRRSLRGDVLDVAVRHLLQEERAVRDPDARRRLRCARTEVEVEAEQDDGEDDPPACRAKTRRLR